MALIVGADIGGTFADFAAVDTESGAVTTLKVLTTPKEPGRDIASGLRRLADGGIVLADIGRFVHGTTVGVNTIIQRAGARVALFTTAGFTDILELARLRMPNPYSLFCERPPPLVARQHVFAIAERMSATGETLVAPSEPDIATALSKAKAAGCQVIVVSFLHAWREPRHERFVAAMIAKLEPAMTVFAGSDVWPVIREYERTTTAVMNAYVQPRIDNYLKRVAAELKDAGVKAPLLLTTSSGGTMTAEAGRRDCVGMLLSGTASGVVGAALVAKTAGLRSVLTLDIGGTSADVALLVDGEPSFSAGLTIGEFPLATPTVAVQSSGQGGGSTPGPACFDRGGKDMTMTDAAMIVGILGHGPIGYGAIEPRKELAERAAEPIAARLDIGVPELAEGVLRVAVSGMLVAIEQMLARAGVHASELTLMPFGGAGPMLGTMLAEAAGIKRIFVASAPGNLCALGAASAPIRRDTMRTVLMPLDDDAYQQMTSMLDQLTREAESAVNEMVGAGLSTIRRAVDLRYAGQSSELTIPLGSESNAPDLISTFHETYERTFGHTDRSARVQVVNLRVSSTRSTPPIRLASSKRVAQVPTSIGMARLYAGSKWQDAHLYRRQDLTPGAELSGPSIVIQDDTTLLMSPGWFGSVDEYGNIALEQA